MATARWLRQRTASCMGPDIALVCEMHNDEKVESQDKLKQRSKPFQNDTHKIKAPQPKASTGYLVKTNDLLNDSNCWAFLKQREKAQGTQSLVQQLFNYFFFLNKAAQETAHLLSADKFYRCRSTAGTALIWQ